ncbi:hypothetical protein MVEN_01635200 [Mycena venus]|uniref:Kinesin light chain n=1 Tax=Mycena venus TaxID=2733690 RepID=A0A8H6XN13_9AGAR|nr:hypothetical protein MVEN_01635200 [Mycena venus]
MQSLAASLREQYQKLGELTDLEAGLKMYQGALDLTPEGSPDRAGRLLNLGKSLRDRYRKLGALKDLEGALERKQDAVDLMQEGHPDRACYLQSISVSFIVIGEGGICKI